MTANPTPDLAAVIASLTRDVEAVGPGFRNSNPAKLTIAELEHLLSAARLAQELTALLGPEPVERARSLIAEDTKVRDMLNADLLQQTRLAREEASRERQLRANAEAESARLRERVASLETALADMVRCADEREKADPEGYGVRGSD